MSEKIPDEDHIVKYLSAKLCPVDPDTGIQIAIPQAFRKRPEEDSLSCAWLEYYDASLDDQLAQCVAGFKAALTVRKSGAFAVGHVLAVRDAGAIYGPRPRVLHEPEDNHQAHAGVRQLADANDELLQLLADEAWADLRSARPFCEP